MPGLALLLIGAVLLLMWAAWRIDTAKAATAGDCQHPEVYDLEGVAFECADCGAVLA